MKIKVSPLVVAAAMGLLGPAALAEDDDRQSEGIAGVWTRSSNSSALPLASAVLGQRIEVIPFEDQVLLDDGVGGPQGQWNVAEGPATQQLCVEGSKVTRRFDVDGDTMAVQTTVDAADGPHSWTETFVRTA